MKVISVKKYKEEGNRSNYYFFLFNYLKKFLLSIVLIAAFCSAKGNNKEIETYIKVWGVLKYYHPNITKNNIEWDKEFLNGYKYLVNSNSCDSAVAYFKSILHSDKKLLSKPASQINTRLSWIADEQCLNSSSKEYILQIIASYSPFENKYVIQKNRNILSFLESDSVQFSYNDPTVNLLPLARYWNIMNYFNPYIEILGDWNAVLERMIVPFLSIKSETDYIKCLHLLNATIHDSHALTSIFPINKTAEFFGNRLNKAFKLDVAYDTIFISEVSSNNQFGLARGDILVSMNSKPVEFWIDSMSQIGSYSYRDLNKLKVIFELSNEPYRLLEFSRGDSTFFRNIAYEPRSEFEPFQSAAKSENIPSSILYINPLNYSSEELRKLRKTAKIKEGVILDLRNYPNENFFELEKLFAPRFRRIYAFKVPNLNSPGSFRSGYIRTNFRGKKIRKPIIVLVDHNTKSASELTVLSMQGRSNIQVVGTHTAGASGTVNFIPMPGGYTMLFSSIGIYNLDGSCFQFNGINCDYPLEIEVHDKLNGDVILQKAIKILEKKINQ